jgi:2,3-bisphosphoglycerate-dependent phosphoglycerate mutase
MNLLIIRHGQSEADILEVMEGRADFNLTDLGRKQAELMADWVAKNYKIDKIFSSPLKRASQTVNILSERTGIDVIFDDDLMEWQNGIIAGMPREEARAKYPRPEVKYPHTIVYEQESEIQFRMRAETILSKIINENPIDYTIAVVSHGGLIGQLFQSFIRSPVTVSNIYIGGTGDTGIHEWRTDGNRRGIIHVNLQKHLESL